MKKTRILIADDHALMRVGLRSMLSLEDDLEIVGEATNGEDAVRSALALRPDVVIMDLQMPRLNGADATRQVLRDLPETKVIILTSFGSSADLQRAVANGAVGLQPKEDPTENLIRAIRSVVAGETAFPDGFTPDPVLSSDNPLTERQTDILRLVVSGQTGKQIAKSLGISEAGVKKHLKLVFTKLGASNRTEACAIALRRQLLTADAV